MNHPWEYLQFKDDVDLNQGDILIPTEELTGLFQEIHPHFCDKKYIAFIITTQTCDLVRRNQVCSAKYINLAVVRYLSEALPHLINSICNPLHDSGIYTKSNKNKIRQLLERVLNQNEQKLGLFHLYPDAMVDITQRSVAFLRVNVTFRSDHYELMLKARKGGLPPPFSNKLGWLMGNLYGRVGTDDWKKNDMDSMINELLDEGQSTDLMWFDEHETNAFGNLSAHDLRDKTPKEVHDIVSKKVVKPKIKGSRRVCELVQGWLDDEDTTGNLKKLENRLINDSVLKTLFKK